MLKLIASKAKVLNLAHGKINLWFKGLGINESK
jgi:hypothetical protein